MPKLGCFKWQSSHLALAVFTAPGWWALAHPAHHRVFPSSGIPKLGPFKWQSSHLGTFGFGFHFGLICLAWISHV